MTIRNLTAAVVICAGSTALAAGSGAHGHDAGAMPAGRPGTAAKVDRTVEIRMVETDGGMGFEPGALTVEKGQTLRLKVLNAGALDHEIVLGSEAGNLAHKAEMASMSGMMHDDPNALRLAPGEAGTLVWTFDTAGTFQFACLIPGHMEAGMHGPISVE